MPLFCRHNRYTAECPICSRGTVLDRSPDRGRRARRAERPAAPKRAGSEAAPAFKGPFGAVGPYEEGGERYEVRLERVPGGLRLAEWSAGRIRRRAPVLRAADLPALVDAAVEGGAIAEDDALALGRALVPAHDEEPADLEHPHYGASPGRAGELREELRLESLGDERLRVGRWILRPNAGWELQEAPVLLPVARFAEALASATGRRVLASGAADGRDSG